MADGEINRNGATIRIDDDGGVQVEPADGQEVEYTRPDRGTDAIRDSVNTDEATINQSYTDPTGYTQDRKLVGAKPIPTPTAYFSGPAHGEGGNPFVGATLAPDGRVVFAPRDSSNVGIFDSSDGSYTSGPAHGEGGIAFFGATLAPDGRVVFAPFNSDNVGIFDSSDGSYTSGPAHGEGGGAFRGATLAPDGRVVFAPNNSENVGITSQLLDFAVANGGNK